MRTDKDKEKRIHIINIIIYGKDVTVPVYTIYFF